MKNVIDLVDLLLRADPTPAARTLFEASVRRPPRGNVYIATFTGPEGGQMRRSTGLSDYDQALELARKWESKARAERLARKEGASGSSTSSGHGAGGLSQREVAAIMNMSERAVRETERRAFRKLKNHPKLREFWREYLGGDVEEALSETGSDEYLTYRDIATLWGLSRNWEEKQALRKALSIAGIELV